MPKSLKKPRRLRYGVAMSLDGFIARLNDTDYDWIVMDPGVDFKAMYSEYDTAVLGRKTWDVARAMGEKGGMPGIDMIVFSRSLAPEQRKGFRITNDDPISTVAGLKKQSGKDIWLFGGGELFRSLLSAGLVDSVEVAVIPVLLGDGIPLLPPGVETKLELVDHKVLPGSGIVALAYSVPGGAGASPIQHIKPNRSAKKKKTARAAKRSPNVKARTKGRR